MILWDIFSDSVFLCFNVFIMFYVDILEIFFIFYFFFTFFLKKLWLVLLRQLFSYYYFCFTVWKCPSSVETSQINMAKYSLKSIVLSIVFLFRLYSSTSINNLLNPNYTQTSAQKDASNIVSIQFGFGPWRYY